MKIREESYYPKGYFEPVNIKKVKEALSNLLSGEYSLNIPVRSDDPDMLISRAIDELEKYRLNSEDNIEEFISQLDTSEPTEMRIIEEGFNFDLKKFRSDRK